MKTPATHRAAALESWEAASLRLQATEPSAAPPARISSRGLWSSPDGKQRHGIWEMTPGTLRDVPGPETVVILNGRATVTADSGESMTIGPGDVCVVHAGHTATWEVHATVRKFFVVNN